MRVITCVLIVSQLAMPVTPDIVVLNSELNQFIVVSRARVCERGVA
jgi:hypothetical protein